MFFLTIKNLMKSGVRSSNSCVLMNEMGFKKTYNLLGGIVEWDGELIK